MSWAGYPCSLRCPKRPTHPPRSRGSLPLHLMASPRGLDIHADLCIRVESAVSPTAERACPQRNKASARGRRLAGGGLVDASEGPWARARRWNSSSSSPHFPSRRSRDNRSKAALGIDHFGPEQAPAAARTRCPGIRRFLCRMSRVGAPDHASGGMGSEVRILPGALFPRRARTANYGALSQGRTPPGFAKVCQGNVIGYEAGADQRNPLIDAFPLKRADS